MKMQISNYPNYYVTENGDIFHNERKLKPYSKDFSRRKLAELFNVTLALISDTVNGKLWS